MNPAPLARVARYADREALFRRVEQVLVAVSGGADSVACLLVLRELAPRYSFTLQVAHFDHQLRPESKEELAWVRDLCAKLDVPFLSGEGDVGGVARQQKASIEDTARRMRYQFLAFVAAEKRIDCIATGHTADDQAETVLMRVLRGTGVRGIRGMLPSSPVPGAPAQRLIRPLLPLRREETEAICAEAGIDPLVDSSNQDSRYARNRLRNDILPALREVNPSVEEALIGLAQSARELFADVERASFAVQPLERGPAGAIFDLRSFAALPNEVMTLVIEREASFYSLVPEVNRTRLENLRQVLRSGTGQVLFFDTVVQASAGRVRVGPEFEAEPFEARVLNVPGITLAGPWRVQLSTDEMPATEGAVSARVDTGRQKGALRLRRLVPGDRMRYHGLDRKVTDILANAKVPAWERVNAVAVADSEKVLTVVTADRAFETDPSGEEPLYLRLTGAQPAAPGNGSRLVLPS
ncbi:MAG: tRNA lysidine(34) synthetase TilS [Dehalococcoidia bacterium]|nr:tRNA lysidine(34) synthetase TilS [Dehalococcoidia bacterium]